MGKGGTVGIIGMMRGIVKARRRRDSAVSPIMKRDNNNKQAAKGEMSWMNIGK